MALVDDWNIQRVFVIVKQIVIYCLAWFVLVFLAARRLHAREIAMRTHWDMLIGAVVVAAAIFWAVIANHYHGPTSGDR